MANHKKKKLEDKDVWKDLAYRMAKHLKCRISEIVRKKRPHCSIKTKVLCLEKKLKYSKGSYIILKSKTWQELVEGICTGKAIVEDNLFNSIFISKEILECNAVMLSILGFGDLIEIAEKRINNADKRR